MIELLGPVFSRESVTGVFGTRLKDRNSNIVCSSPEDPLHNIVIILPPTKRQNESSRPSKRYAVSVLGRSNYTAPFSTTMGIDHIAAASQLYGQNEQYAILSKLLKKACKTRQSRCQSAQRASYMRAWH